jgi:hypothetical protein
MTRILTTMAAVLITVALFCGTAEAWTRDFGIGVILGEPTGFTAKAWLDDEKAIDMAAAWSFRNGEFFHLHADYLMHKGGFVEHEAAEHMVYFGLGALIEFRDDTNGHDTEAGMRIPLGMAVHLKAVPVELFVELAPVMEVTPSTSLHINAGIGARYYF